MDEFRQVLRGMVGNGLEGKEKNFKVNAVFDEEPMAFYQDRVKGVLVTSSEPDGVCVRT